MCWLQHSHWFGCQALECMQSCNLHMYIALACAMIRISTTHFYYIRISTTKRQQNDKRHHVVHAHTLTCTKAHTHTWTVSTLHSNDDKHCPEAMRIHEMVLLWRLKIIHITRTVRSTLYTCLWIHQCILKCGVTHMRTIFYEERKKKNGRWKSWHDPAEKCTIR